MIAASRWPSVLATASPANVAAPIGALSKSISPSSRAERALAFARRGWFVFPCHWATDGRCSCGHDECSHVGKHPLGRLVHSGATEATTDIDQITEWWTREPFANIGIATGPSRLVVLDVDPRHGGDKSLLDVTGEISAADLSKETYSVQTPGDGHRHGYHLYFIDGGDTFASRINLRPGLDVRGDTGYVIAASSVGANGGYECVNDVDPAPVPSRLRDELLKSTKSDTVQPAADGDNWVATKIRGVPEGERNDTAARLAGHFLGRGESQEVVELLLCDFVARCGGPPVPESEIRATAKSIARAEALKRESSFMEISEPWPVFAQRVAAQPKRRMLIEKLIPEGIGLFHGQPRAGKSPAVLECLLAIATSTPAFGLDAFTANDPVPAWYITEEDPEPEVRERFKGLYQGRGMSRQPESVDFSVWRGMSLDGPEWQSRIIETVRRRNIQLVVIDPLRSLTANTDQGPAEFGVVAQFLRRLRRETNCPSIWLVHHDTKPTRNGQESRRRQHRVSGGAILAFCEFSIHFERLNENEEEPLRCRVTPESYKFMRSPAPFGFTLDISDNGALRLVGNANVAAVNNRRNGYLERILQFVKANPGSSKNKIAQNVRGNRQEVLAEINALHVEGVLVRNEHGWTVANVPVAP